MSISLETSLEVLAHQLYDHYCQAVGGKAFNGDSLPKSEEFFADETKAKQANAWRETAKKAYELQNPFPKEETFLDRLIREEKELGEKILGLSKAINTDGFAKQVGGYQFELLVLQHSCMTSYRRVLIMRIADLENQ